MVFFLFGCGTTITKTTSPNGLTAYDIRCSGAECMETAGNLCSNKGYNVTTEITRGQGSKIMQVECKQ